MAKKLAFDAATAPAPQIGVLEMIEKGEDAIVKALLLLETVIKDGIKEAEEKGNRSSDLVGLYRRVYNVDERLSDYMKKIGALKDSFKYRLLPEAYEREGISVLTTSERDRVSINQSVRASILADNRQIAYAWLRESGNGAIIQETVNASTLSSFVKEELKLGRDIPENSGIKYDIVDTATLTRGVKP